MFVVVGGSLCVLLPRVRTGAFVRACLMLALIWTVGLHFFSPFFFRLRCVCQECACAKSLMVCNQELDMTFPVPGVYDNTRHTQASKQPSTMEVISTFERCA